MNLALFAVLAPRPSLSGVAGSVELAEALALASLIPAVWAATFESRRAARSTAGGVGSVLLALAYALVSRGREVNHFPAQTMAERDLWLAFGSAAVGLGLLLALRSPRMRGALGLAAGASSAFWCARHAQQDTRATDLVPALQSAWLFVHLPALVFGACCLVAASALAWFRRSRPSLRASQGAFEAGFMLWTVGVACGFLCSFQAWGRMEFLSADVAIAVAVWLLLAVHALRREGPEGSNGSPIGLHLAVLLLLGYGAVRDIVPAGQVSVHRPAAMAEFGTASVDDVATPSLDVLRPGFPR